MVALLLDSPRPLTIYSLLESNAITLTPKEREIFRQLGADDEVYKQIMTPVIANLLGKLASKNEARHKNDMFLPFDFQSPPDISITRYLERIVKYTPCSKECFFVALIFLDRIIENVGLRITERNVHRLLITSIMISAKLLDDETFNNGYYSKVGGLAVGELNGLEIHFLEFLHYNLSVSADMVQAYRMEIERLCLAEANSPEFESETNVPLSSSSEEEENESPTESDDPDFPRSLSHSGYIPRSLIGVEKTLRRSKSFSTEATIKTHRRRRSSSFQEHIEIQPMVVLA